MQLMLASHIMARTTLNIDTPLLDELKKLKNEENKSLGRLVSDLLAEALARRDREGEPERPFEWTSQEMNPLVDISDKEALWAVLDEADR